MQIPTWSLAGLAVAAIALAACATSDPAVTASPPVEQMRVDPDAPPRPAVVVGDTVPDAEYANDVHACVMATIRLPNGRSPAGPIRLRWATDGPGYGGSQELPDEAIARWPQAGVRTSAMTGLPSGRVWVEVTVASLEGGAHNGLEGAVWLNLRAGHRTDVTFDFDRGYAVEGRLVTCEGLPVTGRLVHFSQDDPPADMTIVSAITDAEGRFRLEGLSRKSGALVIRIPGPRGGPAQVVIQQHQVVEDVVPGEPGRDFRVDVYDPNAAHAVIIM